MTLVAILGIVTLGVAAYFLIRPRPQESAKPTNGAPKSVEPDNLNGSWEVVSFNGKTPEKGKQAIYVFERGKLVVRLIVENKEQTLEETYQVDKGKDPKTIDMTTTVGGTRSIDGKTERWSKKENLHGIYSVEGDKLRLCFTDVERARPSKFASDPKAGAILIVFERVNR